VPRIVAPINKYNLPAKSQTAKKEIHDMTSSTATVTPTPTTIASSTWNIDPSHSIAEFKIRHMMISYVKGTFSGITGILNLDETDYSHSNVEVSIPAISVRTADSKLDAHLKNADFFDVEKFPTLTFKSTNIHPTDGNDYAVTGNLTIHGVTKSVTLSVEDVSRPSVDPWGNQRIGLSGSTKIHRKDFGIIWNTALDSGGMLVGDEVAITLDIQLIKG
jgi:polyisoprenoid-binding protein YceI